MGKSPGKWIKGIFGKKTSKSNLSNGSVLSRCASEKPARLSSKEPVPTLTVDAPIISSGVLGTTVDKIDNSSFDEGEDAKSASDVLISSSAQQDGDLGLPNDSEKIRLEQAATVLQASFRSYQARRAFQTLKGVIKLQAFVRGRLVRRQAVATLFCVQGIVKFQAITRGHIIRKSVGHCRKQSQVAKDASSEIKHRPAENLLKNALINEELLSSTPNAMPLHIQYSPGEPNSARDWLLRWSISHVWAPNSKSKDYLKLQISENIGNDPNQPNAGTDKRKDKVKRDPKKNPEPNKAENDIEKPKKNSRKLSKSPVSKLSERISKTPTDKQVEILAESAENNDVKSNLVISGENNPTDQLSNNLSSEELVKLVGDESRNILLVDKDHKSSRRISLPAKNDDQDATCENATRVPSYMSTTASSKAKVKAQKSPRFGQDSVDKNSLTRRYSLPSSINGKLSSSPRVHKLVQDNGKNGKMDSSLLSSRDVTDKSTREDWKR